MMVAMASCSSNAPRMINPTSADFASGGVAHYLQVANQPAELSLSRSEEDASMRYIRLKTILAMKSDGLRKTKADDVKFPDTLAAAAVTLVDGEGAPVAELRLSDASLPALRKLLTGNAGDTTQVVFEAAYPDKGEARDLFRSVAEFTPSQTADIEPVAVGFYILTEYVKRPWGVRNRCELRVLYNGTAEYVYYSHYPDSGKTETNTWRGIWTSDTYERGSGRVGYYQLLINGWGGSTIRLFLPKSLDHLSNRQIRDADPQGQLTSASCGTPAPRRAPRQSGAARDVRRNHAGAEQPVPSKRTAHPTSRTLFGPKHTTIPPRALRIAKTFSNFVVPPRVGGYILC